MIKTQQAFFRTSDLKHHGFYGDKATILYSISENYSLSVRSEKFYFLEIGPVREKLWSFESDDDKNFELKLSGVKSHLKVGDKSYI